MPLSEHEQRQLEQIELALIREDPKFGRLVGSGEVPGRGRYYRRIKARVMAIRLRGSRAQKWRLAALPAMSMLLLIPGTLMLIVAACTGFHPHTGAMVSGICIGGIVGIFAAFLWVAWVTAPVKGPPTA
jgi:hypothetical protein